MVEPSLSYLVCVFQVVSGEPQQVVFTIPIFEPMPSQYYISAVSDRWLGSEAVCIINFQHLILPERHPPHTGTVQQTHTHTDQPSEVYRGNNSSYFTRTPFFCLFSLTNVPIRCLNVALWILRAAGPAAVAHHRPGEPGVRESVQVHPLQSHPDTDLHRSTTPTPTSCWGRQRAPVKPSLPSWPCSESSTSTLPPRSVCPLHSISLFFSFNIALHFSLFILALCVFSGGVHCPSESSGQGED